MELEYIIFQIVLFSINNIIVKQLYKPFKKFLFSNQKISSFVCFDVILLKKS